MPHTNWLRVWIAFLGGCVCAFQIGKSFASLALIIEELSLNLVEAGLLLSLFSLIAALAGAGFGLLADRVGHLYMAMFGLFVSACGAFAGSTAVELNFLLFTRLIEGLGFILAIVAMPSLIARSTTDADRPLAMGLWGAFMPAGIGLSMLITPVLLDWHGWRGLWNDVGIFMIFWAALMYIVFKGSVQQGKSTMQVSKIIQSILKPGPILVVIGFICYSSLYQSLTAFLPTILVTDYDLPIARAAHFGAFVVVGNIIGNLSAGWLIGKGHQAWKLLIISFCAMLICASLVFATFTDPATKVFSGFLFSAFGGIFPGTAFVLAARFSASPSHMAMMAGLMLQGAGIGQTIGPMMVTSLVEFTNSWNFAILVVAMMAGIGLVCSGLLRKEA